MKRLLLGLSSAWIAAQSVACSSTNPNDPNGSASTAGDTDGTTAAGGSGQLGSGGGINSGNSGGGTGSSGSGAATGSGGGAIVGSGGTDGAASGGDSGNPGTGGGTSVPVVRPELVTSGVGAFWKEGTLTASTAANPTITVNTQGLAQKWMGFGGTFNEAGWDALGVLTAAEREQAIKWLFSASEGANFAWGRIPIGASDYAMDRYTLNETPNDVTMSSFSIARDQMRLIPYIKAAQAVKGDIKFWGSPWTPPTWMKTPAEFNGTDLLPDSSNEATAYTATMKNDAATLGALALYFARWIQAYEGQGIPIDHVQPQNEPGYATRYPSCLWAGGLLGTFVGSHLGPTLEAEGLDTDIWFGTLSNNDTYAAQIAGLTGAAAGYVTGVGLQWNTMSHIPDLRSQGYLIMQTEHKCGNYPWLSAKATSAADANRDNFLAGMAPNNHAYGEESWDLIKQWVEANVNIYSAWNMVLDTNGQNLDEARPWPQNALLVVDRAAKTVTRTSAYYVFRHLSYFVDPGADRLTTTGGNALAFKNLDQSIVAVVYNNGGQAAATSLKAGDKTVQFDVPAHGWASVLIKN